MYLVEGNIGAGKSTFLTLLAQHIPYASIAYEPREHWQSEEGGSILTKFYEDPKRWAFTMETWAMIQRVRHHTQEQQHPSPFHVMERSVYSGFYAFAKNDLAQGFMTNTEWDLHQEWFNFLVPGKCQAPTGIIYLHTNPEIAFERMKKRNRGSEGGITLEYMKQIDDCHTEYLLKKNGVIDELKDVPVLVLDCNEEFEANPEACAAHMKKVEEFMLATAMGRTTSESHPSDTSSLPAHPDLSFEA